MRVLDLFSGIGGFSLGLERAGMTTVAFCEIEEYPRQVLAKHWPGVKIYDDVRELTADTLQRDGIAVDVICGGFPCQDISIAGRGAGLAGERSGLWREFARLVGELRPQFVIVENVAALLGRGLGDILGDLAALGYDAQWHSIPAAAVGAPHERDRIWIIAYPDSRDEHWRDSNVQVGWRSLASHLAAFLHKEGNQWPVEPRVPVLAYGIPNRVERCNGYGNAVVPQIPEMIGRAIMAAKR